MRAVELGAVVATGLVFLALPKPPASVVPLAVFIVACMAAWFTYGVVRVRRDPALLDRWGLRPTAHLGPLLAAVVPGVAVAAVGLAGIAWARGSLAVPGHLALSLALYPAWGLVQQWLVQALVVDNVRALTGAPTAVLVALGAVGFGVLHVEHPLLVAATAVLGGIYVALFQRWRNLWPLAVAHGWLGTLFYAWVLDRDPVGDLLASVAR